MNRGDVAIATMTLARTQDEQQLLRWSLERLAADGWPISLCDGGSPPSFVTFARGLSNTRLVAPQTTGLVGQVKAAVADALQRGTRFVLYTEPDKLDFFGGPLAAFVESAPGHDDI